MNTLRHIILLGGLVAALIASAAEQPAMAAKCAATLSTNAQLRLLQGTWVGGVAGDKKQEKITVTVACDSFRFHRDTNFWFDTTIKLPAGTEPKQLFATIRNSAPPTNSVGEVVGAIYKIEDETLILATGGSDSTPEGTPKGFEAAENQGMTRYELRKIQPGTINTQPSPKKEATGDPGKLWKSPLEL